MTGIGAVRQALVSVLGPDASSVDLEEQVITIPIVAEIRLDWDWGGGWNELPGPWSPGRGRAVSSVREANDALEGEARATFEGQLSRLSDSPDQWQAGQARTYDLSSCGVQLTCGTCDGSTQVRCGDCGGGGQVSCSACHGFKRVRCQSCRGAGKTRVYGNGSYHDRYCSPCGGSGNINCVTCGSSGRVRCGTCQASGRVPCRACTATGSVTHVFYGQATITPAVGIQTVNAEAAIIEQVVRRHSAVAGACAHLEAPGEEVGQDSARFSGELDIHRVDIRGRLETASAAFVGNRPQAFRIEGRLDTTVRSLVDNARQAADKGRVELEQLASARPWISELISDSIGSQAPEGLKRFADAEARRAPDQTIGAIIRELLAESVQAEARELVGGAIRKIVRATREEQSLVASRFLIAVALAALVLGASALAAFGMDSLYLTLDPGMVGGWKSILTMIGVLIWAATAWILFGRRMERFHRRVAAPSESNGARREAVRGEKAEARAGLLAQFGITASLAAFMLLAPPWPIVAQPGADAPASLTAEPNAVESVNPELPLEPAALPPESALSQDIIPQQMLDAPEYGELAPAVNPEGGAAETAPASPRTPVPTVITNPTWARPPAVEFPERALSRGLQSGVVQLKCSVAPSGALTACEILSETPEGGGFGVAALSGARRARVNPREVNGVAEGASVSFAVRFRLD